MFEIFATAYIIGESQVRYQIGYITTGVLIDNFKLLYCNNAILNSNLKDFKYFCGERDAFDCAGIRARVFRKLVSIK